MSLPKLKSAGLVGARASTGAATKRASDYDVAWVSGLAFRNSDATAAVCVTPRGKSPADSGLHLTTDAAAELADALTYAAGANFGAVEVTNHRDGVDRLWQRFSQQDAVWLADNLAGVSGV